MTNIRYFQIGITILTILFISSCKKENTVKDLKLWYKNEARVWEEALPLGNGRIGAMVFGNPANELYQLNEETLWSGKYVAGNNPKAKDAIPLIRKAIDNEDYVLAARLWKENAQGPYSARYLPLADLYIQHQGIEEVNDYYRDLNISKAVASVSFESGGVKYTRTSFISYPDQVMVVKIEADKKNSINAELSLTSQLKYKTKIVDNNNLVLTGKAPEYVAHRKHEPNQVVYADNDKGDGINFEVRLRSILQGGESIANDSVLRIKDADEVILILAASTDYNGLDRLTEKADINPDKIVSDYLDKASGKSYTELLNSHTQDYSELFNRVELDLGTNPEKEKLPTDERLKQFTEDDSDNNLVALYYQFGRYLSIASSRAGGLPSNLQGIWNRHVQPPWGSNYTTNINTEMNYWLTETTHLPECHEPLFDFISLLASNGNETARVSYGIDEGWMAHHNSDGWGKTSSPGGYDKDPSSRAIWSCWPMSGPWFSQHLWEHYLFGGDIDFLKTRAYPLMKGTALSMLKWLYLDKKTGYYVTSPSSSPENTFQYTDVNGETKIGELTKAATMDMALIWDLFSNCIQASEILNQDKELREQLITVRKQLYPPHIGARGQLQEWDKDFKENEPEHRHASHLFGLHPGKQISPRITPELASAAKKTLILRGDGGTGWAMAWKINFWARLEDGNHAYAILKNGLNFIDPQGEVKGGGTYPNLFDAHPPFQIDGNFGGTAGITEMLLQSHAGEIFILPALPDKWPNGSVKGLRVRGGFIIDMKWEDSKPVELKITSTLGGNCRIRSHVKLQSKDITFKDAAGNNPNPFYFVPEATHFINVGEKNNQELLKLRETYLIDFETHAGISYFFNL